MARKRKAVKVNTDRFTKEKPEVVTVPHQKGKFIIGDDVRDMFRNRGKDARKKD